MRFSTLTYPKGHNNQWELTFKALGWNDDTVERFWSVFCKINQSSTGQVTISEFLTFFSLDRSKYVEKCFLYFDAAGGKSIDFLEFIVSVWNICTLKIDTLANFTFDLYDLDSDGELSLPEIERMVLELYGNVGRLNGIGKKILDNVNSFAEERGGFLNQTSFTVYTMNHSMLLFPAFQIQRRIQSKVMGLRYWVQVERSRSDHDLVKKGNIFDVRHVQVLLKTYQSGGAAAVLSHTGDPNVAIKKWFGKHGDLEDHKIEQTKKNNESNGNKKWNFLRENVCKNR